MKTLIATALLGTAIVSGAAYAQQAQPADRAAPAATAQTASSEKIMLKGKWRASKLMGLDVYNEANEKLGDVNELILDKDGKVAAVVIGGTLLTGGAGFVGGTLIGILIQGLIQTYITFDGTLSSWWTKILIGFLLFAFILMQKGLLLLSRFNRRYA